ncbi:MAG: hypothetical protein ACE14M_11175 [Terriglobales bacterium]
MVILLLTVLALPAWAIERSQYQTGTLLRASGGPVAGSSNCYTVAVQLGDIIYVASQCPVLPWNSFLPHEFIEGGEVQVRVDNSKLILQRPNGKELRAKILRQMKKPSRHPEFAATPQDNSVQPQPKAEQAPEAPDPLMVLGMK